LENDPGLDLDAVVLFKSPIQAWWSYFRKIPKNESKKISKEDIDKYFAIWAKTYENYLYYMRPVGIRVFVNFDRFAKDADKNLRILLEKLSLKYDSRILQKAERGHSIGGNANAVARLKEEDFDIRIIPLEEPPLPDWQKKYISGLERVQTLYERLDAFAI